MKQQPNPTDAEQTDALVDMIEQLMDADGFNYEKYDSKFNAVATFILVYAKFGYEFTNVPEDMVPFFDTLKGIIKECISSRVPTTRIANINKLMIAMYPVLKEQIENVSDAINDQMQSSGPSGENLSLIHISEPTRH